MPSGYLASSARFRVGAGFPGRVWRPTLAEWREVDVYRQMATNATDTARQTREETEAHAASGGTHPGRGSLPTSWTFRSRCSMNAEAERQPRRCFSANRGPMKTGSGKLSGKTGRSVPRPIGEHRTHKIP